MHIFPNSKRYVGITKQLPELRWQNGNGYVRNEYMHRAIQKYGWNNISHVIVKSGISKSEACETEKELIKQFSCCDKMFGYNILEGGDTPHITEEMKDKLREKRTGSKASVETREKMRKSRLKFLSSNPDALAKNKINIQKAIDKAAKIHGKKVVQFDLNWNKIAVWESTREAERCLGIQHSHIGKCCNHVPKYKTAGGYRWEYYGAE